MILLGCSLLARQFLSEQAPPDEVALAAPQLDSLRTGPKKSHYTRLLSPMDPKDPVSMLFLGLAKGFGAALLNFEELETTFELNRVLRSGQEFDARVRVDFHREGETRFSSVKIDRENASPFQYEVEIGPDWIPEVKANFFSDDAEAQGLFGMEGELPIAVGDLDVADLLALAKAVQAQSWTLLGRQESEGARPLILVEILFEKKDEDPAKLAESSAAGLGDFQAYVPGRGASALIYLDLQVPGVRRVRIFNRDDELIRTYEDFQHQKKPGGLVWIGFRASSVLDGSHSLFRFDEFHSSP